jgi:hypothetical protein
VIICKAKKGYFVIFFFVCRISGFSSSFIPKEVSNELSTFFFRLQSALEAHDPYFIQKRNTAGMLGLSSLQKMTAALRILAYEVAVDSTDEYVKIGENTAVESLKKFVKAVVNIFSEEYLRSPNSNDIVRLLAVNEKRGFLGMLGSIDCMHWKWKNCPTAWKC